MKTLTTSIAALSVLTIIGMVMTSSVQAKSTSLPVQVSILSVILSALSSLLMPLSSILGMPTIVAPPGEWLKLGPGPVIAWIAAGVLIGILARRARNAIPPALLTPALIYLLVLGLSIYVLPRVPGSINWEVYLSEVASAILLDGPLDFVSIYLIPLVFSVLSSNLFEASTAKPAPLRQQRHRFWEMVEEE